ncbi:MAG: class I SAM-dependent methyltransferase [Limisphaerales bacterium]
MNSLAEQLRHEIQSAGPMTFARFMEAALYAPGLGYYEQPRGPGRAGDFFTSVSVGPLFGQLLAFQFAQWLDTALPAGNVQIVEAGAHDGRLAADILGWLERRRPDLLARLEYCLLDPSPVRRRWQEETLRRWAGQTAWITNITDIGTSQVCGVIFSNEFLDALPVHRLAWNASARNWQEWRVDAAGERFVWRMGELSAEAAKNLPKVPEELAPVLPDGFILELSPLAAAWWSAAAKALRRGRLLTLDYGTAAEAGLRPDRVQGTLRAFAHHSVSADVLASPGRQDLTADIDFSALEEAGQAAGLRTAGRWRQAQFLTQIVAQTQSQPEAFESWNQKNVRQFQTLTHPEHLGWRFQALAQSR